MFVDMEENQNNINAFPVKDFFIEMLTKDIELKDAIIDLIDNSIDGALNIRPDQDFKGLWVHITIDKDEFTIKDNCGGFSLDIAKDYAFRFGRPKDAVEIKGSIGRFGVGMKRALFKIGKSFQVESKHLEDHFEVNQDVDVWSENLDNWNFQYSDITNESNDLNEDGTYINVKKITSDVSSDFSSNEFLNNLISEAEKALNFSLEKNIEIKINNKTLNKIGFSFYENDDLKPYYFNTEIDDVKIKIYAGLGETGFPDKAGWYIYCNNRLVVDADKTNVTGWEAKNFIDGANIRKFHHMFAMFRGVVFFESEHSNLLPLTTTKSGIDSSSQIYKETRKIMMGAMLQVHNFLKEIDKMKNPDEYRKRFEDDSQKVDIIKLYDKSYEDDRRFIFPTTHNEEYEEKSSYTTISFKKEKEKVNEAKKCSGATTNYQLGDMIFDYYYQLEVEQ